MRNLKRALSLALASVMLLGMMVVGTSAAGYPDVDAQDNLEAIEVMKLLGVMAGDENGKFNPDKNVTRNEMAVIMTHLLKLNVGGTTPFTDVPAWAQPYVAACYANGVVAGTSATTFGGNDSVTAAQAALMVMKALGYFQFQGEFKNDWQLAVATRASKIALFDGISAAVSAPLTRNEVAKLCLNALKADVVVAEEFGGMNVSGNGITVSENATYAYTPVARTGSDYQNRVNGNAADKVQQLVEKLFDNKVQMDPNGATDDFGRPCTKWTYAGKSVTSAKAADAIYTAEVNAKTMYNDLGLTGTITATVYTDGTYDDSTSNNDCVSTFAIIKNNTSNKLGGNGVRIEAYKTLGGDGTVNAVDLIVTNTYVGEVNRVVAAKGDDKAYITITPKNAGYNTGSTKFETEAFAKDDVVLYTVTKTGDENNSEVKIQTVKPAEKVSEVKVTKVTGGESFVAGGTTYKYNKAILAAEKMTNGLVDSVRDLYLDESGYVIYTKEYKSASNYAYVLDAGKDDGRYGASAYYAKLLMVDGTVSEVKLNKSSLEVSGSVPANWKNALEKQIVSFTKNSKDEYTLTANTVAADTYTGVNVKKGETKFTVGSTDIYANAKTLFLVQKGKDDKATYTAYTGYANVPTLKAANATATVYCKSAGLATVVFVKDAAVTSSTKDIVFVMGYRAPTVVNDTDAGKYYTYKAVVNGEITTIDMNTTIGGDVLYSGMSYDDYKIAQVTDCITYSTTTSDDNHAVTGTVTAVAENDTIRVNNGTTNAYYALSSNVQVFEVVHNTTTNSSSKIEMATLNDLEVNASVKMVVNSGEVVAIFWTHNA